MEKWRAEYGKKAEAAGGKLTPTAILIKVLGIALKVFPQFNASIDMAHREIAYKRYFHIGIAVDTPHGLLVPVVRDVDQKNIIELAVELSALAQKTRERKIGPADMQGGSMTISNVGTMGGTAFTPIVNPPEVAILGVARSHVEPTYIDGQLQPRTPPAPVAVLRPPPDRRGRWRALPPLDLHGIGKPLYRARWKAEAAMDKAQLAGCRRRPRRLRRRL